MIALAVLAVCALALVLHDLSSCWCNVCRRAWGIWPSGQCYRCWRAAYRKSRATR